MLLEVLAIYKF